MKQVYLTVLNKVMFMLAFVLISLNMFGQVAGDFRTAVAANGNWNDTLQWEPITEVPVLAASTTPGSAANSNVTIRNGAVINFNSLPANPILNLTVGEGASGELNFNTANMNITVNGTTVVDTGAQLKMTSATTGARSFTDVTVYNGGFWLDSSSTVTIKGNIINNGSFYSGILVNTLAGRRRPLPSNNFFKAPR